MVLAAAGLVLSFLVQIFVSRALGVSEYGTYSYALAVMNMLVIATSLDSQTAALRFVGMYKAVGEWSLIRGFIRAIGGAVLLTSLFGALGSALAVALLQEKIGPQLSAALFAACLLLVPASLMSLVPALLQAFGSVYGSRVPHLLVRPLVFGAVLFGCIFVLHVMPTAATAILANTAGSAVALGLSLYLWPSVCPRSVSEVRPKMRATEWLRFCAMQVPANFVYLILSQQSDIVIVGSLVGTVEAGLYSAANLVASLIAFGGVSVVNFVLQLISELHHRNDQTRMLAFLRNILLISAALTLPALIAVLLSGQLVLKWFGPEFVTAYPVLAILSIGYTLNALWGYLWGYIPTMTGFQKDGILLAVVSAAINLALTVVLTPRFGMIGAATATTLAVTIRCILVTLAVYHRLGFWPWTVFRLSRPFS